MKKLIKDIQKYIDYNNEQIKELTEHIEGMPSGQDRTDICIHIRSYSAQNVAYRKILHKIKFPS